MSKLLEKRNQILDQAEAIVNAAIERGDAMTEEETAQHADLLKQADAMAKTIEAEQAQAARRTELQAAARPAIITGPAANTDDARRAEYLNKFVDFVKGNLPKAAITRAANGEALIPETLFEKITRGVKMYGGVRAARVTVHNNVVGTVNLPVSNDTNKGKRTSTGAATAVDPSTMTSVPLTPWEYTSNIIVIDRSLLDGTPTDVEDVLAEQLSERVAKIVNEECTTGTGTGMPNGVLNAAIKGADAAATADITFDELTDLEHSVPAQFRTRAQWMFNDNTLKVLKKKKDGEGRPLWVQGLVAGQPSTFMSYEYVINNDMPDIGAGAKPVLFGDFTRYHVCDGLNWSIRVLNELYAANNQVGFVLFSMHGGTLADAAGAIKYLQNAAA